MNNSRQRIDLDDKSIDGDKESIDDDEDMIEKPIDNDEESFNKKYRNRVNNWFTSMDVDKTYGPRKHLDNTITLGNKKIRFSQNSLLVEENTYPLTPDLIRLLFNKNPTSYTEQDLDTYKIILIQTSAYLTQGLKIYLTTYLFNLLYLHKLFYIFQINSNAQMPIHQ